MPLHQRHIHLELSLSRIAVAHSGQRLGLSPQWLAGPERVHGQVSLSVADRFL